MSYNTNIDLCYKPFVRTIAFFLVKQNFLCHWSYCCYRKGNKWSDQFKLLVDTWINIIAMYVIFSFMNCTYRTLKGKRLPEQKLRKHLPVKHLKFHFPIRQVRLLFSYQLIWRVRSNFASRCYLTILFNCFLFCSLKEMPLSESCLVLAV